MGLFSTKKKEDPSSNSSAGAKQQRPSPSPNNAQGPNNSSHSMQGGMHGNSGYNGHHTTPSYGPGGANNASTTPLSPVGQQAPFSPVYGPPSSSQFQNPNFSQSGPPGAQLSPQLFWTQRRILGTNPFPRFQHTTSATVNGTDIYLYGGSQRGTTKGDLFVIDSGKKQLQPPRAALGPRLPPTPRHVA
ncbi:MAG: hypothetical protein J3Q66DRAFT_14795 [Benniella sp.]|nr:MAG: hypothetical protein J3Q66DRAFT_14795 [Benniella sp.]